MDDPQIEIAYATNEEYLPVLGTSLHSLIEHTSMAHRYRISILMEEIATEQQERILNMQTKNVSIRFVDVHPWTKEYQIPTVGHLSQETAYRLVLDQIFREQEKVVYIDADTLIFHDVAELFSIDIGEHVLGAVLGRLMSDFLPYVRDVLKFPLEDYFNAGILVINLPKFRRLNIGKRALSMLHSPKYLTRDQDVLNILCHHDVQYLDGRWNVE